jgi:hypothetical protein
MLELNEQEWSALCVADERTFVAVIRNDIVRLRPELSDDPELPDRLYRAYEEAKRLGFVHDQSIVRFLYLEVDAPNFYKQNAITAWLSQDGKPSEERFGMLLDVLRVRMTERTEKY